jgi:two-component system, chemotaxis family, response regulator WspF
MRIGIVTERLPDAEVLVHALALKPEYRVIWIVKGGANAVELSATNAPDLILIDMFAGKDGIESTRQIMASTPCPILIVTGSVHTNAEPVLQAMGHGALDAVDRPVSATTDPADSAAPLLAKIATIARLIGEKDTAMASLRPRRAAPPVGQSTLIAIGSSAGGPAVLVTMLRGLPEGFGAAIVVIQHVDARFAVGMAHWLSQQSAVPVTIAKEGDRPVAGRVLIAATSDHLTLTAPNRLGYTKEPRHYVYRPSVDVFFESVCRHWRGDAIGVLLTGMGRDGALGLKALRDRGHHTIAQDRATSAVYGMPKAAADLNAAVDILPMERIASRLVGLVAAVKTGSGSACRRPA